MTAYKEMILGTLGEEYARERLGDGYTLASLVDSVLRVNRGLVRTYLPTDVCPEVVRDFYEGYPGLSWSATTQWLVGLVRDYLGNAPEPLLIMENNPARIDDPWLVRLSHSQRREIVAYGSEVYHVIEDRNSDPQHIETVIRKASSAWISLGFLTTRPPSLKGRHAEFSLGELQMLAQNTGKVIVGAYDGQGWIVWERS